MNFEWIYRLIDWNKLSKSFSVNKPFVGYGPVNNWPKCNARSWTAKHVQYNVPCVAIEAFCYNSSWDDPDGVINALSELIFWCKRRGLMLFVSVANDNKGKGKYGDDGRGLDQFRPAITKVLNYLKDQSWNNLYIQPVAETQTPAGTDIEKEAIKMFSSSQLVNNGNGGFPKNGGGWAAHYAVHPSSTNTLVSSSAWNVSDHTKILNEFGGVMATDYNDAIVQSYAKKMLAQGTPFILYGFKHLSPSSSDLKVLGNAMKNTRESYEDGVETISVPIKVAIATAIATATAAILLSTSNLINELGPLDVGAIPLTNGVAINLTMTNSTSIGEVNMSGATFVTGPTPISNEGFATAGWVLGKIALGVPYYSTTNPVTGMNFSPTSKFWATNTVPPASSVVIDLTTMTNGQRIAAMVLPKFVNGSVIRGPLSASSYITYTPTAANSSLYLGMEAYYTYDGTNLLGAFIDGSQLIQPDSVPIKMYPWSVSFNDFTFANDGYFVIVIRIISKEKVGNLTWYRGGDKASFVQLREPYQTTVAASSVTTQYEGQSTNVQYAITNLDYRITQINPESIGAVPIDPADGWAKVEQGFKIGSEMGGYGYLTQSSLTLRSLLGDIKIDEDGITQENIFWVSWPTATDGSPLAVQSDIVTAKAQYITASQTTNFVFYTGELTVNSASPTTTVPITSNYRAYKVLVTNSTDIVFGGISSLNLTNQFPTVEVRIVIADPAFAVTLPASGVGGVYYPETIDLTTTITNTTHYLSVRPYATNDVIVTRWLYREP